MLPKQNKDERYSNGVEINKILIFLKSGNCTNLK